MTNGEILNNAIEKAMKNGWAGLHSKELKIEHTDSDYNTAIIISNMYTNGIIFNHDFAKAFWGESEIESNELISCKTFHGNIEHEYRKIPAWEYHLQRMVLVKEPLKYVEKFL